MVASPGAADFSGVWNAGAVRLRRRVCRKRYECRSDEERLGPDLPLDALDKGGRVGGEGGRRRKEVHRVCSHVDYARSEAAITRHPFALCLFLGLLDCLLGENFIPGALLDLGGCLLGGDLLLDQLGDVGGSDDVLDCASRQQATPTEKSNGPTVSTTMVAFSGLNGTFFRASPIRATAALTVEARVDTLA
jgi:hypothetical protein